LRSKLRTHFRLLVNKPVHHDSFFARLAGSAGNPPAPRRLTHFGFRVLVVEDNPVNQRLVQRVLTNLGCMPTAVDNGRQALNVLAQRAEEFDVVLLDLHMPEMDGIETLREIRAGKAGPHAQNMWGIALTADARDEQRERAMAAGVNDYLTKPLKPVELEAALRKFRSERAARKAGA
jgi:CheY-like chemotaxis protein